MSGIAKGGGGEMDRDTDRGGEDRRMEVHTHLSIELLVKTSSALPSAS